MFPHVLTLSLDFFPSSTTSSSPSLQPRPVVEVSLSPFGFCPTYKKRRRRRQTFLLFPLLFLRVQSEAVVPFPPPPLPPSPYEMRMRSSFLPLPLPTLHFHCRPQRPPPPSLFASPALFIFSHPPTKEKKRIKSGLVFAFCGLCSLPRRKKLRKGRALSSSSLKRAGR